MLNAPASGLVEGRVLELSLLIAAFSLKIWIDLLQPTEKGCGSLALHQ